MRKQGNGNKDPCEINIEEYIYIYIYTMHELDEQSNGTDLSEGKKTLNHRESKIANFLLRLLRKSLCQAFRMAPRQARTENPVATQATSPPRHHHHLSEYPSH